MDVDILRKIALYCGQAEDFCFNSYHAFLHRGVGIQLKSYRKEHKMTQSNLAAFLGVACTTVKRWESEESRPSPCYVEKLFSIQ